MNKQTRRTLCQILLLCLCPAAAAFATTTSTILRVSDTSPGYSETVTLTSITLPTGGLPPAGAATTGTVSFYEDNGLLLQTVNIHWGIAQWSQKFLAGTHTVYAVFSGNPIVSSSTSAAINLNVKPALAVPASGAYLGIRADPALGSTQEAAIEVREGSAPNGIGRPFAAHLLYYGWKALAQELDSNGVLQPDPNLEGDITHGRVPVIAWGCDGTISNSDHDIAAGDPNEDAVITATAKALAQYPGPVLLRWFWEFNVLANGKSCRGDTGGAPTQQVYSDFIGAWQHIWQLFQSAGATNVVFLWNPGYYKAGGANADPHGFYPGNTYVDWIGIDTYQRSVTAAFSDNVQPFYGDFTQSQFDGKPLLVGENGSQNWVQHSEELQWTYLQGLLAGFEDNLYPQIKAYCYFDSIGPAGSWVLDDNNGQGDGGLAAFTILGANPLFSRIHLMAAGGLPAGNFATDTVALPISLTNTGLLPAMNPQIDAITDISVTRGIGSVTTPDGPIPLLTPLAPGQTATVTSNFNWPPSAISVQMTVHFSANQGAYSGQTTFNVSRFPFVP